MPDALNTNAGVLLADLRLIAYDADGLLEACFQLGRLWRERTDEPYPIEMHDPTGACDRAMSDETGEDAAYWILSDALSHAGAPVDREVLEVGRAARYVCLMLETLDDEREPGEWLRDAVDIEHALDEVVPAWVIAQVLAEQAQRAEKEG